MPNKKDKGTAAEIEKRASSILTNTSSEIDVIPDEKVQQKQEAKKVVLNPKPKKPKEVYYFYSLGCAWCKRIEPHLDELIKEGYNIVKLDTGEKDNREAKQELEAKFKFSCGTPALVNPENGYNICGYKDKDVIKKFVEGEKIPTPPRPKSPPPSPPKFGDDADIERWKKEYTKWRDDNQHVKNIPATDLMLNNLKQQFERNKQGVVDQSPQNLSNRLAVIESKLERLIQHLGVK